MDKKRYYIKHSVIEVAAGKPSDEGIEIESAATAMPDIRDRDEAHRAMQVMGRAAMGLHELLDLIARR